MTTGSKCPEACQAANWCHPHRHQWPGMQYCLGCAQRASSWVHIPVPEPVCLYGAGTAKLWLPLCSCCGTVPPSALLRASPVHTYSVISPSWRRNSKLSKIKVLGSKSDCDSVISWEQTCWVRHCSCSSSVKMDGFIQWAFILGFLFHDISSIPWLAVFIWQDLITEPGKIMEQGMFPPCSFSLNSPSSIMRMARREDQFWPCQVT